MATKMHTTARKAELLLLDEAGRKTGPWTPDESRAWTRAFNALQRLAGKKIMARPSLGGVAIKMVNPKKRAA